MRPSSSSPVSGLGQVRRLPTTPPSRPGTAPTPAPVGQVPRPWPFGLVHVPLASACGRTPGPRIPRVSVPRPVVVLPLRTPLVVAISGPPCAGRDWPTSTRPPIRSSRRGRRCGLAADLAYAIRARTPAAHEPHACPAACCLSTAPRFHLRCLLGAEGQQQRGCGCGCRSPGHPRVPGHGSADGHPPLSLCANRHLAPGDDDTGPVRPRTAKRPWDSVAAPARLA